MNLAQPIELEGVWAVVLCEVTPSWDFYVGAGIYILCSGLGGFCLPDKEGTTLSIKPGYYGGFNTLLQEMNMALEKVQKAGLKCCPIREAV